MSQAVCISVRSSLSSVARFEKKLHAKQMENIFFRMKQFLNLDAPLSNTLKTLKLVSIMFLLLYRCQMLRENAVNRQKYDRPFTEIGQIVVSKYTS